MFRHDWKPEINIILTPGCFACPLCMSWKGKEFTPHETICRNLGRIKGTNAPSRKLLIPPGDERKSNRMALPEPSVGQGCGRATVVNVNRCHKKRKHTQAHWPPSPPTSQAGRGAWSDTFQEGTRSGTGLAVYQRGGVRTATPILCANMTCPTQHRTSLLLLAHWWLEEQLNHFLEPTNEEGARGQWWGWDRAFRISRNYTTVTKNLSHQSTGTMKSHVISRSEN